MRTTGYPLVKTMHHFHFTFSISSGETKNLKGSVKLGGDIWAYPGLHFVHRGCIGGVIRLLLVSGKASIVVLSVLSNAFETLLNIC